MPNQKPLNRTKPANPNEMPDILCPKCGCGYFQPSVRIKFMSSLLPANNTRRDQGIVKQVFCCMGAIRMEDGGQRPCGHIVDMSDSLTFITSDMLPDPVQTVGELVSKDGAL